MDLKELISGIAPLDEGAMEAAKRRWDSVAHPLGSLGLLERDIIRIAGITGSPEVDLGKKAVVVMCADNGVVAEGVTQTGQEVTAIVTENMSSGDTSVCRMARVAGAEVIPVEIGVARPVTGERILQRCVRRGTANMTRGPAMGREEAERAVLTGAELVGELKARGYRLLATGEMGIGNTTTSSAVVSVLLGRSPAEVTGRGAGLSTEGYHKKIRAIETAVEVNCPDPADALDVLYKVGGLDLAGLAGVFLGGSAWMIKAFYDSALTLLCVAVPVAMLLGILWNLYDRECSWSLTVLGVSLIAMWVCRRGLDSLTVGTYVRIAAVVYIVVLIAAAVLANKAEKNGGKLGRFQVLTADADPLPVYLACGLSVVGLAIALFSAAIAYYAMWVLAVVVFALAVYYTVKQL